MLQDSAKAVIENHTASAISELETLNKKLRSIVDRMEVKKAYYFGDCPVGTGSRDGLCPAAGVVGVIKTKINEAKETAEYIGVLLTHLEEV